MKGDVKHYRKECECYDRSIGVGGLLVEVFQPLPYLA